MLAATALTSAAAQPARPSQTRAAVARAGEAARAERAVKLAEDRRAEEEYWASIQVSDDPSRFRAYLGRYPSGQFTTQAKERLRAIAATFSPPVADPAIMLAYVMRISTVDMDLGAGGRPRTTALSAAASAPRAMAAYTAPAPTANPTGIAPQVAAPPIVVATAAASAPPPRRTARPRPLASNDVLVRPTMIDFDLPALPASFCSQLDLNSYLTDFHALLDEAAKANNDMAISHYEALKRRFSELVANAPGSSAFVAVNDETRAYAAETRRHYKMAADVNALDTRIRTIPISGGSNCAHQPWPEPTRMPSATSVEAQPAAPAPAGDR